MTEEQAGYDAHDPRQREVDGVEHIGDVIQRMIDSGTWRHLAQAAPANSNGHPGKSGDRHG